MQSPGQTTMVMDCAAGTPSDVCGFPEPITLTVGPSTLHYTASGIYQIIGDLDCKITAHSTADCTVAAGLYTDPAGYGVTGTGTDMGVAYPTTPAASSTTTQAVISGTDVTWLDVTITAGLEKLANATSTSSSASGSGSRAGTSASNTGTSSSVMASATGNVAAGSFKGGCAGLGAAAVLVAGSMMML